MKCIKLKSNTLLVFPYGNLVKFPRGTRENLSGDFLSFSPFILTHTDDKKKNKIRIKNIFCVRK